MVERLEVYTLATLAPGRRYVVHVQLTTHPPSVEDSGNSVAGQRTRKGKFLPARTHKPHEEMPGMGDDVCDGVLARRCVQMAEADLGMTANGGQKGQEPLLAIRGFAFRGNCGAKFESVNWQWRS